ncbi:MAG: hypothetical protein HW387_1358 [Parachlamydiales bacterium]|nr:hypothetical protein [Parachlamydiales bacterium]
MARDKSYHDELIKDLKDHEEAAAYLSAAWEQTLEGDEESYTLFLVALRNVAEAQGGLGSLARKTHIRREQLYRILSPRGNPGLKKIGVLLTSLGFVLKIV